MCGCTKDERLYDWEKIWSREDQYYTGYWSIRDIEVNVISSVRSQGRLPYSTDGDGSPGGRKWDAFKVECSMTACICVPRVYGQREELGVSLTPPDGMRFISDVTAQAINRPGEDFDFGIYPYKVNTDDGKGKFKCVDYCEGGFPCYPMRAVQTYIATGAPGGAPLPDILYTINPPIFLPKLDYDGDLKSEYKICFNDGDPSDLPSIRKRIGSRDYKAIYLEDLDEQATDTNGISIGRGYSSNSGDYNIAGIG